MKILVLGAGIVGVTSAWFLAQDGHEVTVIERREGAGLETSFANGGQLAGSSAEPWANPAAIRTALSSIGREDGTLIMRLRADPAMWLWCLRFLRNCTAARARHNRIPLMRLGLHSRAMMEAVLTETAIAFDEERCGILDLVADPRALEREARHGDDGTGREVVDQARCLAIEPALEDCRDKFVGGLYFPTDRSGDAYLFTHALAADCERLGVEFCYDTAISRIRTQGDMISSVEASAGSFTADAYVLCLGSESRRLARPLGLRLPIYPVKGYSVTIPTAGANRAPRVSLSDETRKIVISRLGDRLRAAGTAELAGHDRSLNAVRSRAVLKALLDLFPNGGDAERAEFWTGLRPMTPDGAPILGPSTHLNLFLNTGHGTLGWTMACGTAELLADVIAGRPPAIELNGLTLARF